MCWNNLQFLFLFLIKPCSKSIGCILCVESWINCTCCYTAPTVKTTTPADDEVSSNSQENRMIVGLVITSLLTIVLVILITIIGICYLRECYMSILQKHHLYIYIYIYIYTVFKKQWHCIFSGKREPMFTIFGILFIR